MAVTAPTIKPRLSRHTGDAVVSILEFPEGAVQTFLRDEFVMLTSGLLVVATDGSVLTGLAMQDATGTTGTMIKVAMMDGMSQFIMNLKEAASANHVYAAVDLGLAYGIQVAANVWTLNQGDTTGPNFRVIDLYPGYAVGDTNVWVYATPVGVKNIQGG